jgi:hypothetical protein
MKSKDTSLVKHVDIAGVVVTHALLQELGIGAMLEALHREGLVVSIHFFFTGCV